MVGYIHVKKTKEQREKERAEKKEKRKKIDEAIVANLPKSIHGLNLIEVEYVHVSAEEQKETRKNFNPERNAFLLDLAENHTEELRLAGFTDKHIEKIRKGEVPCGWSVHHKLPISGGGKNEFSNFLLIAPNAHQAIHRDIIDPQVRTLAEGEKKIVKIPWSDKGVFIPQTNQASNKENNPAIKNSIYQKLVNSR